MEDSTNTSSQTPGMRATLHAPLRTEKKDDHLRKAAVLKSRKHFTLRQECENRAQHSKEKRMGRGKQRLIMDGYNEMAILVSKECD